MLKTPRRKSRCSRYERHNHLKACFSHKLDVLLHSSRKKWEFGKEHRLAVHISRNQTKIHLSWGTEDVSLFLSLNVLCSGRHRAQNSPLPWNNRSVTMVTPAKWIQKEQRGGRERKKEHLFPHQWAMKQPYQIDTGVQQQKVFLTGAFKINLPYVHLWVCGQYFPCSLRPP